MERQLLGNEPNHAQASSRKKIQCREVLAYVPIVTVVLVLLGSCCFVVYKYVTAGHSQVEPQRAVLQQGCWTNTGKTCTIFRCAANFTDCVDSHCVCQAGYCSNADGDCKTGGGSNVRFEGVTFQNVKYPELSLKGPALGLDLHAVEGRPSSSDVPAAFKFNLIKLPERGAYDSNAWGQYGRKLGEHDFLIEPAGHPGTLLKSGYAHACGRGCTYYTVQAVKAEEWAGGVGNFAFTISQISPKPQQQVTIADRSQQTRELQGWLYVEDTNGRVRDDIYQMLFSHATPEREWFPQPAVPLDE